MLKILRIPDRAALQKLIQDFDPQSATWVVSDLRSKFEIQQRLLDRDSGYLDTSVMRASDLWKTLLKRAAPAVKIISRDFAKSIVRHFLSAHKETLSLDGVSENFLLSLMDRFAGIIFHPNGPELIEEWFAQNEEAVTRWKSRYQVAGSALRYFASEEMITAKWVASTLQRIPEEQRTWDKPLIVDLGAELTSAEAMLFHGLSRVVDVTILEPSPVWRAKDEFLLRPYRDLEGFASEVKELAAADKSNGQRQVKRFSGQLAEVKEAVAQVRAWMEEGVPTDRIAVLAPEIEDYWPVLKPYLDEEGLPSDKAVSVKLNALPVVNRWLARLRPRRGELTPADLELAYYAFESSNPLRYEQFRSLFVNLYGEEDLHRHESVRQFFEKKMSGASGILPRDVFLEVASRYWENLDNTEAFLLIAREVLQNAHGGMELSLGDWIRYVEAIAASKEMTLSPASPGGLFIGNFLSAHAHPATHRIFLGLSEEGLRKA
ncbi:MAG: PD-(D/E)XK nuclease family protein, partial [Bdellovibrionaceae bacterium]|nr:PD-(D/E)XK nuclease family protein [Pseudobdellovibrionaceae bacterium]